MITLHPMLFILLLTLASVTVASAFERASAILLNYIFNKAFQYDGLEERPVKYET